MSLDGANAAACYRLLAIKVKTMLNLVRAKTPSPHDLARTISELDTLLEAIEALDGEEVRLDGEEVWNDAEDGDS